MFRTDLSGRRTEAVEPFRDGTERGLPCLVDGGGWRSAEVIVQCWALVQSAWWWKPLPRARVGKLEEVDLVRFRRAEDQLSIVTHKRMHKLS